MDLTKISIKRPVTTVIAIFIVLMFGMVSLSRVPLDLFPTINIPILIVSTSYEGAGPHEVENLVTKPIEQSLASVNSMDSIQSISSNGSSMVMIQFVDGTDMDFAALDVREKIDLVKGFLPDQANDPMVISIDPNAEAIVSIGITGDYELDQIMNTVEDEIISRFERIDGVGSVDISGDQEKEISVTLIPEKLEGYGITASTVSQILQAENLDLPVGDIAYGSKDMTLRVVGQFENTGDIRNVSIPTPTGPVKLSDVADIEESYKDMSSYSYINGTPSITLSIKKQSTANTVDVAKQIRAELNEIISEYDSLNFTTLYDSAQYIEQSIDSVANAALMGMIFSILVLFVFLRNVRSTLIIAVSMPLSIVFTFVLMYFMDISLNMISLGGLTLGVGMLVDSSIVVLENIYRHRQEGASKTEGAYKGTKEVAMAVVASTLTTMAVFIPMIFVEGITASIFTDLSLTIVSSLLAALIVAITIVPMMSSKLLNTDKAKHKLKFVDSMLDGWEKILDRIDNVYRKLLKKALGKRKATNVLMVLLFIATLVLVPFIGFDFMPALDEGLITVNVSLPHGTREDKTFDLTNKVLEIADTIKEDKVIHYTVQSNGSSSISIDVSQDENKRETNKIIEEIRSALNEIPGAEINVAASSMGMMGMMGKPIQLQIIGDDLDMLTRISEDVVQIVEGVEGTRGVSSSIEDGIPEAQIIINRDKASMVGLTLPTITQTLQGYVSGQKATELKIDGGKIDVRVSLDDNYVSTIEDIKSLAIPSSMGTMVILDEIADIKVVEGPVSISRTDGKRYVTVESDLYGLSTGKAMQLIEEELKGYQMPKGYSFDFTGEVEQMTESFSSLALALIMAVFLVYFVLAAQFESFINPFIIMFSVPYALTGAILALFITNYTLDMTAMMGMIMLSGIVVNNAIVLISYIIQLRDEGLAKEEAILKAGPTRLRPILMTTLTTVLAMIPVALGIGEGTELIAPLAISVIGGLLFSTIITLIIIPINYAIFEDFRAKLKNKRAHKKALKI